MKRLLIGSIALAAVLAMGTSARAGAAEVSNKGRSQAAAQAASASYMNLTERLEKLGNFTILLTALETAGLRGVVATDGPFTLFAPTDQAFAERLAELNLTPADLLASPDLMSILLYHVAPGRLRASQLLASSTQETLSDGKSVLVVLEGADVLVNRGKVTRANVPARNGLIHVIDKVMLPPVEPAAIESIVDVLTLDGRFSVLLEALQRTGLDDAVSGAGPFTLFAPTDGAMSALLEELGIGAEELLEDPGLSNILLYHVIDGRKGAFQLLRERGVETMQGSELRIRLQRLGLFVNDARVVNPNVNAPNGVIHTIDRVLLP